MLEGADLRIRIAAAEPAREISWGTHLEQELDVTGALRRELTRQRIACMDSIPQSSAANDLAVLLNSFGGGTKSASMSSSEVASSDASGCADGADAALMPLSRDGSG